MAPPARRHYPLVAGIDEAGRGPLAGPVVAAAVILDPKHPIPGVRDSKVLSAAVREKLYAEIYQYALAVGVGMVDSSVIDQVNIHRATLMAMWGAFSKLPVRPDYILVDGQFTLPSAPVSQKAIPGGDATVPAISAASIIAKVTRDRLMIDFEHVFPGYGFRKHKGYGTPEHLRELNRRGACVIHRKSFAPVRALLV